ncbi:hypothetical protein HCH_05604 [Hahella chejuensis KCTC 2396]|uniref:Uncharacterized protein n=1 Tax=Hahella chejuensis (strain KCTC 2396) TaxID=349521 RepID=Q2SAR3_HAHCH|nr:hypothetical protein [Hahella chejuensis]ABC32261.1 hypothetical protein HCH_05604 [Hahella chejuensis KCTC 2396]
MYSTRSYAFKHWSDITVADLPFIESPFFAASFADRCLSNDFKVSDVASNLCGYHFRSGFGAFPGRGSLHFRKWKDDFVRGVERAEILLVFSDKKKPFCPVINESEEGPVPVSSEARLAERLIALANPAPPPPPAVTGEVMDVTSLSGNPGWSSAPNEARNSPPSTTTLSSPAPAQSSARQQESDSAQVQSNKTAAQDAQPFCEDYSSNPKPAKPKAQPSNETEFNQPENCKGWGLTTDECVGEYTAEVKDVFSRWETLSPSEKLKELGAKLNRQLTKEGIPGIFIHDESIKGAQFDFREWKIVVDSSLIMKSSLTQDEQMQLADHLLHEARHAEQWFGMGQLHAANGGHPSEIGLPGVVAEAAKMTPLNPESDKGQAIDKMFQYVYGDNFEDRDAVYDQLDESEAALKAAIDRREAIQKDPSAPTAAIELAQADVADANIQYVKAVKAYQNLPEEVDAWATGAKVRKIW